jgi:hypothetical protein
VRGKSSPSPEALGILTDEVRKGVGASTLLRSLGPILDARLEAALTAFEQAPPDLNQLLDLRAKITTLRTLKRELDQAVRVGHEAGQQLEAAY